jgi:hypothetical protein
MTLANEAVLSNPGHAAEDVLTAMTLAAEAVLSNPGHANEAVLPTPGLAIAPESAMADGNRCRPAAPTAL